MNLFSLLPEEDKNKIEEYIFQYGVDQKEFIGLETYLREWSKNKGTLYHLLGDRFIVKIPLKDKDTLESMFKESFLRIYKESIFIDEYLDQIWTLYQEKIITESEWWDLRDAICDRAIIDDKIITPIKIKIEGKKNALQIQKGAKPIRALAKIIKYFNLKLGPSLENLRIKLSMVTNSKITDDVNLVFSIHPLDFMTMSDNDSNWSSCMSWVNTGCFHAGTVEMMNSNNVVCVYIENKSRPFVFNNCEWNNKRWRQLFYITKEIICSGKPYPYFKKEFTIEALDDLKDLAINNLKWNYKYGPQLYRDMIHINTFYTLEKHHNYKTYNPKKKNIIFTSKLMYNDMLNDSHTSYYCYRNKVKKNTFISYSGKCSCAICNENMASDDFLLDDWDSDDADTKYEVHNNIVCGRCLEDMRCTSCDELIKDPDNRYWINNDMLCPTCYSKRAKTCPCCGRAFLLPKDDCLSAGCSNNIIWKFDYNDDETSSFLQERISSEIWKRSRTDNTIDKYALLDDILEEHSTKVLYMCNKCVQDNKENGHIETKELLSKMWSWREKAYILKKDFEDNEKYYYKNLKPI